MTDIANKCLEMLKQLATQIGTTIDKLYPLFIKQAIVESWVHVIIYIALFLIIIALTIIAVKLIKNCFDDDIEMFVILTEFFLIIILIIYFFKTITTTVTGFVNPEYLALQNIIQQLSQFIK